MNKRFAFLLACFVTFAEAGAEELCPLELLKEVPYTDLECQFYLGTTAYRAGAYDVAATHWQRIVNSPNTSTDAVELRNTSRATLAYLKYSGLGIPRDQTGAVNDWLKAVDLGQIEARRQLGFAYSDPEFTGYDPVVGLAWYKSVLVTYPDRGSLDANDQNIYDDAILGIEKLEATLTKREINLANEKAADLAKSDTS